MGVGRYGNPHIRTWESPYPDMGIPISGLGAACYGDPHNAPWGR